MRKTLSVISLVGALLPAGVGCSGEAGISIRLDTYADRRAAEVPPQLFSLPPEEWCGRYRSESIVYLPGEKARITVEVSRAEGAMDGEIALESLVSGNTRVLCRGPLKRGTYGPYEAAITADFEVYQVRVRAGHRTVTRGFYGIRPWRGMKAFSDGVSGHEISLTYEQTTPWELAVREGNVAPRAFDANWAKACHPGKRGREWGDWWLWTHYACGMVGQAGGRTGLFWGEYNPWTYLNLEGPQNAARPNPPDTRALFTVAGGLATETILPCSIYFRERIQPFLREWAASLSEQHPDEPLRISLGDNWGVGRGIGRRFGPETLRYFVSWMNEQFGIVIEADTFKELIRKCEHYPKHFDYFVARNTAIRSLELTCEAVQDVVASSKAWDKNGESNRRLIALPEAAEFCEILSRCIAIGTTDDEHAWRLTQGNPLPYSLSNMVIKAFTPEHNFCVGWNGCGPKHSDGEVNRWYLEPAWITAFDRNGNIRHLYTHSPPTGSDGVWRSLIEGAHAPDRKIRVHDQCFQLMEVIGVEKPIGPVFVCKDWTFADDKLGRAFRSDLYEPFLISLRRHKVPVSCAVHADHESTLPEALPRIYAPRMNGGHEMRFGFRAGSVERWFTCEASRIPDSLTAELAAQLNSASGNPIVFPRDTSIEGYAFEAEGMKFVVAEEMAGRKERGQIKVKVGGGQWKVIDIIAAKLVPSRKEGEYLLFDASLEPNSATLYCVVPRSSK